MYFPADHI